MPRPIAALVLLFAACAPLGAQRLPNATGEFGATASAGASPIAVMTSTYGSFQIKTQPLDSCELAIKVDPGSLGDGPPKTLVAKADLNGIVQWTYATPLIPAGHGRHEVACSGDRGKSDSWAEFAVALKGLDAHRQPVGLGFDFGEFESHKEVGAVRARLAVDDPRVEFASCSRRRSARFSAYCITGR